MGIPRWCTWRCRPARAGTPGNAATAGGWSERTACSSPASRWCRGGSRRCGRPARPIAIWRRRRAAAPLHADLADVIVPAAVRDLTSTRTGMHVQTSAGSWTCDAVLVAAGIDTPRLAAQVGVPLPTLLARHARFTFAVRDPQPERLACWIDASGAYGAGLASYGQPVGTSGR